MVCYKGYSVMLKAPTLYGRPITIDSAGIGEKKMELIQDGVNINITHLFVLFVGSVSGMTQKTRTRTIFFIPVQ